MCLKLHTHSKKQEREIEGGRSECERTFVSPVTESDILLVVGLVKGVG